MVFMFHLSYECSFDTTILLKFFFIDVCYMKITGARYINYSDFIYNNNLLLYSIL